MALLHLPGCVWLLSANAVEADLTRSEHAGRAERL